MDRTYTQLDTERSFHITPSGAPEKEKESVKDVPSEPKVEEVEQDKNEEEVDPEYQNSRINN